MFDIYIQYIYIHIYINMCVFNTTFLFVNGLDPGNELSVRRHVDMGAQNVCILYIYIYM